MRSNRSHIAPLLIVACAVLFGMEGSSMMIGNTGAFLTGKLPYDAEVEYLESTGTQWIDTGYNPHGREPIMSVDMMSIGIQRKINMFGCNDTRYFWLTAGNIAWAVGIGGGYSGPSNLSTYANIIVHIVLNARALTASINSTSYPAATTGTYSRNLPDANVYLFDCNGLAERTPFVGMIYGCTIEEGGILIRHFVPVRFMNELGQTEGAMYDRVSKQLFRNQGTGSFEIGPDKT